MQPEIKLCVVTTVATTLRAFLLEQLVFMTNNGFDITIICDKDEELAADCPKELKYIPVRLTRDMSLISTLTGIFKLFQAVKNSKYDIIQYATPKAAFTAAVAAYLAGIPARLYCQWGIRYVGMTGIARSFLKILEMIVCLCSSNIVPDSWGNLEFSAAEGLYAKGKASVVHNGSANGVSLKKFNMA